MRLGSTSGRRARYETACRTSLIIGAMRRREFQIPIMPQAWSARQSHRQRDKLKRLMTGHCDTLARRTFLAASAGCLADLAAQAKEDLRVLDIHQHTDYSGRSDDQLVAHQRKM